MTSVRPDAGKSGSAQVSFVCQRCSQPLKLDHSFASLDSSTQSELTATLTKQSTGEETLQLLTVTPKEIGSQIEITENVSRRRIPPPMIGTSDSANDFTLLGETEPQHTENLSLKLKVISHLFDIVSEQSVVDHPLCEECTDTLLDQLDQQLSMSDDDCKDYRELLEKLGSKTEQIDEEALDQELNKLQADEEELKQQLKSIEAEREQLAEQTKLEKEKTKEFEEEEESFWKEYNEYKRQVLDYEDAQKSVDNQLRYAQAQLDRLKKTNVFNATFHIWHRGHFGTINNFRLGRLPSVPVDWNEINAAWGQTVLLLHSLANKMNLKFERFRLVPYGNHSFLESLTDKSKELPLYGAGGIRYFWDTKFDHAMIAFLDCLQQFQEAAEKGDKKFCLPYKMDKGKIEDSSTGTSYSIKIQFNSEEQWTKALKFMLTNLKWGLAWVSSQFAR